MKTYRYFILSFLLCVYAHSGYGQVVINQIMYDTPLNEKIATSAPYSNGEFIELYNMGGESVSLSDWKLRGGGKTEIYTFGNIVLSAGGYLIVAYHNSQTPAFTIDSLYLSFLPDDNCQVLYQRKIILSNEGEPVTLWNSQSVLVDSIFYDGTSNKRKENRLSADNRDSIPYLSCVSLHRVHAQITDGKAATRNTDWVTAPVSIAQGVPSVTAGVASNYYPNTFTPDAGANYIVSITPLDAASSVSYANGTLQVGDNARAQVLVSYHDGFGRKTQDNLVAGSPAGKDVISLVEYNGLQDEEYRQWNVIPLADNQGQIASVAAIQSTASAFYHDAKPYAEMLYEASALHRATGSKRQGEQWHAHPTNITYGFNAENEVMQCSFRGNTLTCTSYYPASRLSRVTTTDEDGNTVTEYTDMLGRLILRKRGTNSYTYYVYNDMGQLAVVLPWHSNTISAGSYSTDHNWIRKYAYVYHYDKCGNLISKQLPGRDPIRMVYDKLGRLILQQDGNQRTRGNYWTVYKYDPQGRLAYTTEVDTRSSDHQDLIDSFEEWIVVESFSTTAPDYPLENTGYSRGFYHNQPTKVLTVNYYDNYDFLQLLPSGIASKLAYREQRGYGKSYGNSTGLLTGTRVYSLTDNTYTTTAYYYDDQGRVIQSHTRSLFGEQDDMYFAFNFDGTARQTLHLCDSTQEHYTYQYDLQGRLLQTTYQVGSVNSIILARNTYDEIGNLVSTHRHNNTDAESFAYNVQNSLTCLQSGDVQERLYYCDSLPKYSTACYNGNIASIRTSQAGQALQFAYHYDALNRLVSSRQLTADSYWDSETFVYDHLGNITHLDRFDNDTQIDELYYEYNGNQVTYIEDMQSNQDKYNTYEYHSLAEYNGGGYHQLSYDHNGNLTADYDRGVCAIRYNLLNLPDTIQFFSGAQIINTYDAAGIKRRTCYLTPMEPELIPIGIVHHYPNESHNIDKTIITYNGSFVRTTMLSEGTAYRHDLSVHNPEGYTHFDIADGKFTNPQQYYFRRDHLGSNVAVWNATRDTTVQRTWYYAGGTPMSNSIGQSAQSYKYNGKEFVEIFGNNTYDYGFRGYHAITGRFTTMDPLAEKFYDISPYAYCGGNPVNRIEFLGLKWKDADAQTEAEKLQKELEKLIRQKTRRIDELASKIQTAENDKRNKRRERQINELKEEIPYLQQALVSLDALADDQNHEYAFGFTMGDENYVKKGEDGVIYIIAEGSDLKMHEITHIHQSLKAAGLRFASNQRLLNASNRRDEQAENEVEAYKIQYSINSGDVPAPLRGKGVKNINAQALSQIRDKNGNRVYWWIVIPPQKTTNNK